MDEQDERRVYGAPGVDGEPTGTIQPKASTGDRAAPRAARRRD